MTQPSSLSSRRSFLRKTGATLAGAAVAKHLSPSQAAPAGGTDTIRIGLVGCGGRGTGAAAQALQADPNVELIALGDVFRDRLVTSLNSLQSQPVEISRRVRVDEDHQFVGFDAYEHVLASDIDLILLATPPHFRPIHLRAAIDAGKHVFAEKPVAVDAPGVRSVLESTELARRKKLGILSGLNTRYAPATQETIRRIHNGAIGDIVTMHAARYAHGVWVRPRQPGMTEMEYQMRNWYYFTWLSGDFNVEQFVHQLDKMAWVMGDQYPTRCYSTGGRQARTGPDHGHIYDHFSTVYEFDNGVRLFSTTRHQPGCSPLSVELVMGTAGQADLRQYQITGPAAWRGERARGDSHQFEHDDFFAALRQGEIINNGEYMAKSSFMAILARMSAYTGQTLSWTEGLESQQALVPSAYTWDGTPPPAEVAVPGVTEFI